MPFFWSYTCIMQYRCHFFGMNLALLQYRCQTNWHNCCNCKHHATRLAQLNAKIRPEDIPPLTTIKKGRPFRRPVKPDVLCGLIQAYCFHSPPSGPNQVLFSKNCTWPKTDRPIYKKTNFKLISGAERALRTTSRSPRIRCRKHSALSRTSDKTCLGL